MKKPRIISCFPGLGRNFAINHLPNKTIANLAESPYHFEGYDKKEISTYWPRNYIYRIKELMDDEKIDYIMIGVDRDVRKILSDLYIRYELYLPDKFDWPDFSERVKARNYSIDIDTLYQECSTDYHVGWMDTNHYLYDVLRDIDPRVAYWHQTGSEKFEGNYVKIVGVVEGELHKVVYQDLSAEHMHNETHVIDYWDFLSKMPNGKYKFIETSYSPEDIRNGVPFKTCKKLG